MTQTPDIQQIITQRFNAFFIDIKNAQMSLQNSDKVSQNIIEVEQSKTSRSLLRVEKQAIREKDLNQKHAQNYLNEKLSYVNDMVAQRLTEELKDTENLYRKVIGIEDTVPNLLDLINVKAATISRIESVATELPWFSQDLFKVVNQAKYRRVDSKGKVIIVDNLRVALNRFGIENLNPIVVSLAFRRWLPQITDPYPQIKLRIWDEALATSIVCRKLAPLYNVDENHALNLGMLHLLGTIVVVKLYFRLFDAMQREALIEAQNEQEHERHNALKQLLPSGDFLNSLIEQHALNISAELINMMDMKRVFIANAMQEVASKMPSNELSPLALVLNQARIYSRYRLLKIHSLIEPQEAKDLIRSLHLPKGALDILKTTDIKSLNLEVINS